MATEKWYRQNHTGRTSRTDPNQQLEDLLLKAGGFRRLLHYSNIHCDINAAQLAYNYVSWPLTSHMTMIL